MGARLRRRRAVRADLHGAGLTPSPRLDQTASASRCRVSVEVSLSDPEGIVELWERGIGQPAWRRDGVILAGVDGVAPRALSERNARLMALHGRLFGERLELQSVCPQCATTVEFSADSMALSAELSARSVPDQPQVLEVDGYRIEFRLPDVSAVAVAAGQGGDEGFESHLLQHCVLASTKDASASSPEEWPADVREALSTCMESLEPGASVAFELACPSCRARWAAPLDAGEVVWRKLQATAEHLLVQVDALARAYGWTQREILSLSAVRREAYLQMAAS